MRLVESLERVIPVADANWVLNLAKDCKNLIETKNVHYYMKITSLYAAEAIYKWTKSNDVKGVVAEIFKYTLQNGKDKINLKIAAIIASTRLLNVLDSNLKGEIKKLVKALEVHNDKDVKEYAKEFGSK